MTELVLENAEGMLDFGTHHGDDPVDLVVDRVELAAPSRFAYHASNVAILGKRGIGFRSDMALVGPDRSLIAMQELTPDLS